MVALAGKVLVLKAGAVEAFGPRDEVLRALRRPNPNLAAVNRA